MMTPLSDPEPLIPWRKSRYSNGGDNCLELAPDPHGIILRDSKDPQGPTITLSHDQWPVFLTDALGGRGGADGPVRISTEQQWRTYRGVPTLTVWHLHGRVTGAELHFTVEERDAFLHAARDGDLTFGAELALTTY